ACYVVNLHDSGVVDQDVELGVLRDELLRHRGDALWVLKTQFDRDHSRIRLHDCFQVRFPAAGNDDLISAVLQRLRKSSPDPRTTTRDENRIPREIHRLLPLPQATPSSNEPFGSI